MTAELTPEAWAQIRHAYELTEQPVEDICDQYGISSGTLRNRMRRWEWTRRRPPVPHDGPPPPLAAPPVEPAAQVVFAAPHAEAAGDRSAAHPSAGAACGDRAPLAPAGDEIMPATPAAAGDRASPPGGQASQGAAGADASADAGPLAPRLKRALAGVLAAIETTGARLGAGTTHPRELERAARVLAALTRTLRDLNELLKEHQTPDDDGYPTETIEEFRLRLARKIDAIIAARKENAEGGAQQA